MPQVKITEEKSKTTGGLLTFDREWRTRASKTVINVILQGLRILEQHHYQAGITR
jgi:hypothetical protein